MKLTTILFDLDGTLLPMVLEEFTGTYFGLMGKKMAAYGYDPKELARHIWAGTAEMVKNDGSRTNEQAFWGYIDGVYGEKAQKDRPLFDEFYNVEFLGAQSSCGYNPEVPKCIAALRQAGYRLVLATNPLFPRAGTENRLRWAGVEPSDFVRCTTYEDTHFCKPNPAYYRELLEDLGAPPEECLMVGNDVDEDMVAQTLGLRVFLLTDCLINRHNADITQFPHGDFQALMTYIRSQD